MSPTPDKIIIDIKDYPELAEFFSRKEAGDSVKGRFSASLDENTEGIVTLSIDDIRLSQSVEEEKATPEGEEPVAVKAMRGRKHASAPAQDEEEEGQ